MPVRIPEPKHTNSYTRVPYKFAQEFTATNVFLQLPDGFSPLERMVLQTTGNLQRLLSAYYNVPSRVVILRNELIPCGDGESDKSDNEIHTEQDQKSPPPLPLRHEQQQLDIGHNELDMRFERKILMYFGDKLAYEADSLVSVKDQQTLSLLAKHEYGLGQIFSHLRHTPSFALRSVGRHGSEHGQSFWRDYTLSAPGVIDCYIRETFVEGLFGPYTGTASKNQGTVWYNPEDF
ncbi:hypothetical protein BDA99DRAFT_514476 [Phascolomyces articulosus]|uniref:Uncharacterized protein n=1 Tax=Phascolomyces articulosus TaxID=60185 RepID=A0AAD5PCX3_9FUNG|nr:hypothetical protein BDA99DRAFT_514476 [Phascolomyces articulosus]